MVYRERRHHHHQPCLHCDPQSYIRMVHHLIERCLLFHMTRDDCIQALAKHAGIQPIVTLTVWKGLLKENKSFFEAYYQVAPKAVRNISHRRESRMGKAESNGGEELRNRHTTEIEYLFRITRCLTRVTAKIRNWVYQQPRFISA